MPEGPHVRGINRKRGGGYNGTHAHRTLKVHRAAALAEMSAYTETG
jgi:hypothetical protein